MEKKIELNGPKAVAAIVVVLAIISYQLLAKSRSLHTEVGEKIKIELAASYARHFLPELDAAMRNPEAAGERAEEIAGMLSSDNIEILSISARGWGRDVIARVEIRVNGQDPPDGKRTRYFEMSHSTLTGWTVRREVSKWRYYLTI